MKASSDNKSSLQVFFGLYISLANVAMSIFKYDLHPSGKYTVHAFTEVLAEYYDDISA